MAQSTATSSNGKGATMSTATDKTEKSYEELSKQIESLKTDLSKLTTIMGELGKAEKDRLMSAAKSRGEALKTKGEESYVQARKTAEGYLRDGERYVHEQPGTALGIAAAVGFIVGFLMTSRR